MVQSSESLVCHTGNGVFCYGRVGVRRCLHKLEKCHTKYGYVESPQCALHPVVFRTGFEGFVELREAASPDSVEALELESQCRNQGQAISQAY